MEPQDEIDRLKAKLQFVYDFLKAYVEAGKKPHLDDSDHALKALLDKWDKI